MDGHLILVRSLNYLLRQHTFTYLACRVMAETIQKDVCDRWLFSYLFRKVPTGRKQVYWKYSLFKGMSTDSQPEYRVCLVASPASQVAETWLLRRISQEPVFQPSPFVYSYLWSGDNSGHIYQHFIHGFMRRNLAVAEVARALPNSCVVVLDVKQFYPSIDKARAIRSFRERFVGSSFSPREIGEAVSLAEQLLSVPKIPGVPVGPALSHTVANAYLHDVDKLLSCEFPDRYFRYVDDIAVVVPETEVERAVSLIGEALGREGLKLNDDKKDIIPGNRWGQRMMANAVGRGDHGFGKLMWRLQYYLAWFPESVTFLSGEFRERGYCLPFSRFRAVSQYNPFRRFLRWAFYRRSLSGFWRFGVDSPLVLLEYADAVRSAFKADAREIAKLPIPNSGVERRWFVQDCRFVFNRLLYLIPGADYQEFLEYLPDLPELAATRVVYKALATNDATGLLHYPGPAVSAFSQLSSDSGAEPPRLLLTGQPAQHERDTVVTLAVNGLAAAPAEWISGHQSKGSRLMLQLAARSIPNEREFSDFSYIDEVQSLLMTPEIDLIELLKSRYDDEEEVYLPALHMGGGDYPS